MPLRRRLVDCAMRVCRRDLRRRSTRHTRARRRAGHRRPNIHRGAEPLTCPALSPALSIYLCFLTRVCVCALLTAAPPNRRHPLLLLLPPPFFLLRLLHARAVSCVAFRQGGCGCGCGWVQLGWRSCARDPPRAGLADCASIASKNPPGMNGLGRNAAAPQPQASAMTAARWCCVLLRLSRLHTGQEGATEESLVGQNEGLKNERSSQRPSRSCPAH